MSVLVCTADTIGHRLPSLALQRSAATDLAGRPRARHEATSWGRLPGLVGLVLWRAFRHGARWLGRWGGLLRCGFIPRGGGLRFVLRKTAMFVFATWSATTRLVASRSSIGLSSHWGSVPLAASVSGSPLKRAARFPVGRS